MGITKKVKTAAGVAGVSITSLGTGALSFLYLLNHGVSHNPATNLKVATVTGATVAVVTEAVIQNTAHTVGCIKETIKNRHPKKVKATEQAKEDSVAELDPEEPATTG